MRLTDDGKLLLLISVDQNVWATAIVELVSVVTLMFMPQVLKT